MTTFEEIQRILANAATALDAQRKALIAFEAACIARQWDIAEQARTEAVGHLEAYLDHVASAHKRSRE